MHKFISPFKIFEVKSHMIKCNHNFGSSVLRNYFSHLFISAAEMCKNWPPRLYLFNKLDCFVSCCVLFFYCFLNHSLTQSCFMYHQTASLSIVYKVLARSCISWINNFASIFKILRNNKTGIRLWAMIDLDCNYFINIH